MVPTGPTRRRAARIALAGLTALAVVFGAQTSGSAALPTAKPLPKPPVVPGYGQVAAPSVAVPGALPVRTGSVPVSKSVQKSAFAAEQVNDQVALRALVIATDASDFGVPTWKTTLDRVGAAYDVIYSGSTAITTSTLVRPDGVGKYNAILLTNSMQLVVQNGNYVSALDANEWNLLWAYELNFGVRQAALYTSYGTWPETYCLNGISEGAVGATPEPATLTTAGAGVFDYLNPAAQVPIQESYVYRTSLVSGCGGTALLQDASGRPLAVKVAAGGREKIALTFTSNQYLIQSDLLVYGLLRWTTKGLFLGEQKHHLNVDVDDWFNTSDHYLDDGTVNYTPGFQVSGHDTVNLDAQQTALRTEHPLADDFTFNIAFNGADIDPFAGSACSPNGDATTLTATTKCLKNNFRWLNHTFNHPELNATNYADSYYEINQNRTAGNAIGLGAPDSVLKTPEYSGLGVYSDDPNNDTAPPVDHGLTGSNPAFLEAAKDLGVGYVHGNMSFASHVPAHYNANIVHPLENSIRVVPDWPTNIAYHTTTPSEQTRFYNSFYGPNGLFPFWPTDRTYAQLLDYEAGIGFQHVASGSIYSHTFHIANVRDYGGGQTLLTDWVDSVLTKYGSFYSVPLINSSWTDLAAYTTTRSNHFATLTAGVDAVFDRTANTITIAGTAAGTVQLGGVATSVSGATSYGTDVTAPVTLAAGTPVTVAAAPRSF